MRGGDTAVPLLLPLPGVPGPSRSRDRRFAVCKTVFFCSVSFCGEKKKQQPKGAK